MPDCEELVGILMEGVWLWGISGGKITAPLLHFFFNIIIIRYNLVTEEEMLEMKWLDLKKDEPRTMDTYMDTKALLWKVSFSIIRW